MELREKLERFRCRCGHFHKVVIFREGCKYRVEPGRLVVHRGALVRFVATEGKPEVAFTSGVTVTRQDPESKTPGLFLVDLKAPYGCYPYSVYIPTRGGGEFAEGGSAPQIIVADP